MLIYRVEHKNTQIGPYQTDDMVIWKSMYGMSYKKRPNIYDETNKSHYELCREHNVNPKHMLYAFRNLNDLLSWFTLSARRILHKHEYHIAGLEIPDNMTIQAKRQILFNKKFRSDVVHMDIVTLEISIVKQVEKTYIREPYSISMGVLQDEKTELQAA